MKANLCHVKRINEKLLWKGESENSEKRKQSIAYNGVWKSGIPISVEE